MDFIPYHSRDNKYKSSFGCIAADESLRLRVLLPRELKTTCAYFAYFNESGSVQYQKMIWECMEQDSFEWWQCDVSFGSGLYWYFFEYDSFGMRHKITENANGIGVLTDTGRNWQLTVYEKTFKIPTWLSGGVIYQIFPDRFHNSGLIKENIPSDRHSAKWSDTPTMACGESGCVLNNDYFGGDLKGIEQKLDYLFELGVTCIYLNPIFEAHSNHRYNTADYFKIDPVLGTEEDFKSLCKKANEKGIKIILDGVFSHTGSDSIYFNKEGRYQSVGAYQSQNSPYYSWYNFVKWPDEYHSWWGFKTLPEVNEADHSYSSFITGTDGVLRKWLKAGASGWRLDVADELPDAFIDKIRTAIKDENNDALLLGEVWENASNKMSYGHYRRFLQGSQFDSVMNYPFYNAVVDFLLNGKGEAFIEVVMNILETYPSEVVHVLMNHIGTHDTERILTVLAGEKEAGRGREWQSKQKLSSQQREKGLKLLKLATAIQFTLPGVPSVYYGDEAGLEGYRDPFNRGTYPWGNENAELIDWYMLLGKLRKKCTPLSRGEFIPTYSNGNFCSYIRKNGDDELLVIINRGETPIEFWLLPGWKENKVLLGETPIDGIIKIPPESAVIMGRGAWAKEISMRE